MIKYHTMRVSEEDYADTVQAYGEQGWKLVAAFPCSRRAQMVICTWEVP